LPLCFFRGKKKWKKKSLTIITMMNMWDNEFKIEKCIHSLNKHSSKCGTKWNLHHSLSPLHTQPTYRQTRGVSHCSLAIYTKKYFKAKDELWKFKYFTMQKYNLQKNSLKGTKILQDIRTL
jgi:hypothetical protein